MTNENKKKKFVSAGLVILLVIGFSIASAYTTRYLIDYQIRQQAKVNEKHDRIREEIKTVQESINSITAGINYDQRRKFLITQFQEVIMKENNDISSQEAYLISEVVFDSCVQFKRIDPILILSIQMNESRFDKNAKSKDGAIGINQIIPITGKFLCRITGWQYSIECLRNVQSSTYLACTYLDMLYAEYDGDIESILANYNGGDLQGWNWRNNIPEIYPSVKKYVKNVLQTKEKYSNKINGK